jgi:hypothetical protein
MSGSVWYRTARGCGTDLIILVLFRQLCCICTQEPTYIYKNLHMYIYKEPAYAYAYKNLHMFTRTCICLQEPAYVYKNLHMYIHRYTRTCIYVQELYTKPVYVYKEPAYVYTSLYKNLHTCTRTSLYMYIKNLHCIKEPAEPA